MTTKEQQERIARAGKLSVIANREFLSQNRELLVSFDREALAKSMLAVIRLDHADEIGNCEPDILTYLKIQERAFLSIFDRGAVQPIGGEITSLGWDCVERMRRDNGIGASAAPAPAPVLTPAQELENEVRRDWKNLPSKTIKSKMQGDRNYREALERLAPELESLVTAHVIDPGF